MPVRIVRLGTPRVAGEGLRIGTVRRPPRGVPKAQHSALDYYDVWLPELSPSEELVKMATGASTEAQWRAFKRKFRAELAKPERARLVELLAALSRTTSFSIGCYCADEAHCHRSVLREMLEEHGAKIG